MKLLLAALLLLLSMALICSPLYLVYIGFVGSDVSFWPISIITGKDWKVF